MGVGKWLKNQATAIAFALSSVEKNSFSQNGGNLDNDINQEQRHNQGTLADSLINGVVTAEVEALRWRTYKVLEAANNWRTEITYDKDGKRISNHVQYDNKAILSGIKQDTFDDYNLEMVVINAPINLSVIDMLDDDTITFTDSPTVFFDERLKQEVTRHGEISMSDISTNKNERPIKIDREELPKFQIEDFTIKLHVRDISKTEKLLEFFINKYPDENNRTTRLLISDIKKAIENPRASNMLNIKEVGFITYKTIGVRDFLEYQYKITSFDKIIEFGPNYVIKFKAEVLVDGESVVEKYRNDELDTKYKNKESKKKKNG